MVHGRPDPLSVPTRLSRLLEGCWRKGMATRPPLEADAMIARAVKREGFRPSSGPWQRRLDILCRSLREEADLNALGRTLAFGQLSRIVASRIRAERLWSRRPDILDRAIDRPIMIVGHMRSGTTRMHRLLACDPRLAHTRLFETLEPVPYDLFREFALRRQVSATLGGGLIRACNPLLRTIHPTSPLAPEEEFGLHAFSIWGAQFEGQWHVPGFAKHCEEEDATDVYREFASLVRTLSWHREDRADCRWVLKAPQFAQDLDALASAFPDMMVIRLERTLSDVVGSGASLAWQQTRIQSDDIDRETVGREWLRKTQMREARMNDFFERRPDIPAISLSFEEVGADWRAAMRRIYAFLNLEFDQTVQARMARFMARSNEHRGHRYSLEEFGLDPAYLPSAPGRAQPASAGSSVRRNASALSR